MRGDAAKTRVCTRDAIMRDADLHVGGLANDGEGGSRHALGDSLDQRVRTKAANLFVVGEGEVQRPLQRQTLPMLDGGEAACDKPLHIGTAAPVQPPIAFHQRKRVAGPILAIHRHHVGVT